MHSTRSAGHVAWIVAAILCAACNGSTGPGADVPAYVSLITQATSYAPDEKVQVAITNHSPYFIRAHRCGDTVLDKLTENGWQALPRTGACTDEVQAVSPNSVEVGGTRNIPLNANPGTYRIRFERMVVMPDGAPEFSVPAEQRVTNTFAVR
jgi:hypothetical protein